MRPPPSSIKQLLVVLKNNILKYHLMMMSRKPVVRCSCGRGRGGVVPVHEKRVGPRQAPTVGYCQKQSNTGTIGAWSPPGGSRRRWTPGSRTGPRNTPCRRQTRGPTGDCAAQAGICSPTEEGGTLDSKRKQLELAFAGPQGPTNPKTPKK